MRITAQVILAQPNQLDHLQYAFIQFFLILHRLIDDQALSDDLLDGHTGIQRGNRVLENHLNTLMHHPAVFLI